MDLIDYGWDIFFAAQLEEPPDGDDGRQDQDFHLLGGVRARVTSVFGAELRVVSPDMMASDPTVNVGPDSGLGAVLDLRQGVTETSASGLPPGSEFLIPNFLPKDPLDEFIADHTISVGDWLLLDPQTLRPTKILQRKSVLKRRAPGTDRRDQLIAANLDTLWIVTSCNQDFNLARLERYLALAKEAGIFPVILLTKADLLPDLDTQEARGTHEETAEIYVKMASNLLPDVAVEVVNALDPDSTAHLLPWCSRGQTVGLIGSSGVGKSTLINQLLGTDLIATQGIREDDAKGRHTTTQRTMHRLPNGGWLMDTPGMRELQLTSVEEGIEEVFADIIDLARTCRFGDCRHDSEPGCAITAAVVNGDLEPRRLASWKKLEAEESQNRETLAERRRRGKSLGKMYKQAKRQKLEMRDE